MPAKAKDPLRSVTEQEKKVLVKISRSLSVSADQVARAKALLAVCDGKSYQQAALLAGRKSNDAVSQLVSRFNKEGVAAIETKHGGGPAIAYTQAEKDRIIREFQRTPDRVDDATATWSLVTLQRALRRDPDGLPHVSTYVIWQTLHEAGRRWQRDRSWCNTGTVIRLRKNGPVAVEDPDTAAKKNLIERAYAQSELTVFCEDEAGPYSTLPYPGQRWQPAGEPSRYPHEYIRQGTAKMLTLFEPKSGKVWVKGVKNSPNDVLHGWLKEQLSSLMDHVPAVDDNLVPAQRRTAWESWQAGLTIKPSLGPLVKLMQPLRALLILDNLAGHHTPELMVWLFTRGILPLFTPLGGSWLNMAESIQRILKRRGLEGAHPETPEQIIEWLEQTAQGWNKEPTPFEWGGKRKERRHRLREKSWQRRVRVGGSGAYAIRIFNGQKPSDTDRLSA